MKRSLRATIVMPSVFAIAHGVWSNAQVGLFAAFGSFALLLLVEFTGPLRTRVASYVGLYVVSGALIALGTVASSHEAAAVISMFVVGFAVLFAGIVAPQVATASTAVLLTSTGGASATTCTLSETDATFIVKSIVAVAAGLTVTLLV